MPHGRRSVLAVFVATVAVAGGVVILVAGGQTARPSTGAAPTTRYSVEVHRGTASASLRATPDPSMRVRATRRPTLTVDSGCRLGAGSARLTDVPDAVTRRVDAAWQRIEGWLAAHAPATAATLAKPAPDAEISQTQQAIGVPLPADLVASLRRHDGTTGPRQDAFTLPPYYGLLSAPGIATEARTMCDVLASVGDNATVGSWWHGQFVPVADLDGDSLFLDQRTGSGRLGEHVNEGSVSFDRVPPSLTEFLEQTADVLEGKRPALLSSRPTVTPRHTLDWEIVH
jgi:cell wall assembly regulator SMI1